MKKEEVSLGFHLDLRRDEESNKMNKVRLVTLLSTSKPSYLSFLVFICVAFPPYTDGRLLRKPSKFVIRIRTRWLPHYYKKIE